MATGDPGEFGRRLRGLREAAALSQEELAERANLTAKAIGALERGERRRPYPNTVRALCSALDLDDASARSLADAVRATTTPQPNVRTHSATLPTPATPMMGRDTELDRLSTMLQGPDARLVTLTGPGGVGKTRLALEVAGELQSGGREVVLVELAAIRRVELVVPSIARALGLLASSEDTAGAIARLIEGRRPVLVLDNVEHLLGAATEVGALLERCPELVVLATSRAPLRIRAEREVPISPLAVPPSGTGSTSITESPAVQVFLERARAVAPDFDLDGANAAAVAEICRRLDGLPLALELAAAHVRYLPPPLLLERLRHAVDSARLRDLPERQRTMTATLDWSRDLLTANEREALRALSVFAGGFDIAAAEDVAAAPDRDVLTAIQGLVEQSLVLAADSAATAIPRLRMLEPVREYAAAGLTQDEGEALALRHAAHFSRLGGDARSGLRDASLPHWLDRLDQEHANLGAALTTYLDLGDLDAAARLGSDTWLYWALRGHAGEGLLWWQRVVDEAQRRVGGAGPSGAHLALVGLALATGDTARARTHGRAAVDAARTRGDAADLVEGLIVSCVAAASVGDASDAAAVLTELTELAKAGALGDPWARALTLVARSQVALLMGDLPGCAEALDEGESLAREGAGQFALATVLNMRTTLARLRDNDAEAIRAAAEAFVVATDVGTTWTLVYTLSSLASLAQRQGRPDLAAELFAASATTAETSLVDLAYLPDREFAAAGLTDVRLELTGEEFDRCWARGRALDAEDLAAVIAEVSDRPSPG